MGKQQQNTHGGHTRSISRHIRKASRIPPTHHEGLPATKISLICVRLESLSRFLKDSGEMKNVFKKIKRMYPQHEEDPQFEHLEEERKETMRHEIKVACIHKLKVLISEMMFALLKRHIRVYDQLEDTYMFEPTTHLPGQTFIVPRSAIHGSSMQAYRARNPHEIGEWLEGVAVGLDRETGLYVFEHTNACAHNNESAVQITLIPRSKLRTSVPECKNLLNCPWDTCQAKTNGHGHIFISDCEQDCLHVFTEPYKPLVANVEQNMSTRTRSGSRSSNKRKNSDSGSSGSGSDGSGSEDNKDDDDENIKEDRFSFASMSKKKRKYLYTIGRSGSSRGEFRGPKGICFDAANRLIVADSKNNRIQGFEYLPEAGGTYCDPLHPGIAPNHQKNGRWICTFVYPEEDHTVSGSQCPHGIGTPGTQKCAKEVMKNTKDMPSLCRPSDVTVDSFENVLVADTGNSCIRVLRRKIYYGPNTPVDSATVDRDDLWMYKRTLLGKLVRVWPYVYMECIATWGCRGFGPGTFLSPVSIDHFTVTKHTNKGKNKNARTWKEERYLVVDQGNHNVTQFTLVPPVEYLREDAVALKQSAKLKRKRKDKREKNGRKSCAVQ